MFSASVISQITKVANRYNIEPAALLAVVEVESAGTAFWKVDGRERPPIRFEGHWFNRLLKGQKRSRAQAMGLANPKVGGVKNPVRWEARYDLLKRAKQIDETAALKATSWGLGQVMGFNYKKLGFNTVNELVALSESGVAGQIEVMARYIKAFGLVDELQRRDWLAFAHAYNGPAARKYGYDKKIAKAYARYASAKPGKKPASVNNLTAQVQEELKTLGYYKGPINGVPSASTKSALRKFQMDAGIAADGKYGPITDAAIDRALAKRRASEGNATAGTGAATTGTGIGVEVVQEQVQNLNPYTEYSEYIQYLVIGLVLIGFVLTVYGLVKRYRADMVLDDTPVAP